MVCNESPGNFLFPFVSTQVECVPVQDIKVYEKNQETMAMLKLLAMTRDKSKSAKGIKETFSELRKELNSK